MLITEFTQYDSVRVVLGLSARELKDERLVNELFYNTLIFDLTSVGYSVAADADLVGDYQAIAADLGEATVAGRSFYSAVRVYSAHAVAFQCLPGLSEMSPYYVSDSKAAMRKNQGETEERVTAAYFRYRSLLQEAYAAYLGVAAPESFRFNLLGISAPDFDPVTGG
ncbi:MAG: hypothetical protein ACNA7J_02555 [Wenzhouxiangella sp.]